MYEGGGESSGGAVFVSPIGTLLAVCLKRRGAEEG